MGKLKSRCMTGWYVQLGGKLVKGEEHKAIKSRDDGEK